MKKNTSLFLALGLGVAAGLGYLAYQKLMPQAGAGESGPGLTGVPAIDNYTGPPEWTGAALWYQNASRPVPAFGVHYPAGGLLDTAQGGTEFGVKLPGFGGYDGSSTGAYGLPTAPVYSIPADPAAPVFGVRY